MASSNATFKTLKLSVLAISVACLSGCAASFVGTGPDKQTAELAPGTIKTETKFTSKAYGVAVSERVVDNVYQPIPKGGGRRQVGVPYKIKGRWYKPRHQPNYNKTGIASWYGPNFHGRKTANGEIYDQTALTAAHPTLPLPSYVRVTNLNNKRSVIVRVNDRGPFVGNRIIDLSYRTAELLGTRAGGLAKVRVQYVKPAPLHGLDDDFLTASYKGPGSVRDSEVAAREKLLAYQAKNTVPPKKSKPPVAISMPQVVAETPKTKTIQARLDKVAKRVIKSDPTVVGSIKKLTPSNDGPLALIPTNLVVTEEPEAQPIPSRISDE